MSKNDLEQVELRTNQRHDLLLALKHRQQQTVAILNISKKERNLLLQQQHRAEKYILGKCILRSLRAFDVETSFMADSLHNVYRGVFVRNI
jgi:hypothetical protein